MEAAKALFVALLTKVLGDVWTTLWVSVGEAVIEAEVRWREMSGRGSEKRKYVLEKLREMLRPRIARLPFFLRPLAWSAIESMVEELVRALDVHMGHDWIDQVDRTRESIEDRAETVLGVDLDGDGRIGAGQSAG